MIVVQCVARREARCRLCDAEGCMLKARGTRSGGWAERRRHTVEEVRRALRERAWGPNKPGSTTRVTWTSSGGRWARRVRQSFAVAQHPILGDLSVLERVSAPSVRLLLDLSAEGNGISATLNCRGADHAHSTPPVYRTSSCSSAGSALAP